MAIQATPTGLQAEYFGDLAASPTTFYYWVQARYVSGRSGFAQSNGVNTPGAQSSRNVVLVKWDPMPGAIGYDVVRTTATTIPSEGSDALAMNWQANSFTDNGQATSAYTEVFTSDQRTEHATYNFAVDGGAIGTITPFDSGTLPANAVIVGGQVNVTTAVTSAGSATVSIGTSAGSSATSLLAATAKASLSIDALIPVVPTQAVAIKLSAAGQITFSIAVAALTAGVIEVWVNFYIPSAA